MVVAPHQESSGCGVMSSVLDSWIYVQHFKVSKIKNEYSIDA